MPQAERLSEKMNSWPRSEASRATMTTGQLGNCESLWTIFQPRALFSDIPASRKGVYLFYDPPNFSSRIPAYFVDFFVFLGAESSTSFLFIRHWLLQKVCFSFSLTI